MMKKIKNKHPFNIAEEYKSCWNYLIDSKKFILIIFLIFLVSSFAGYFIVLPIGVKEQILQYLQTLVEETKGMSQFQLTKFIFFNNLRSTLFGIFFGTFLGIFPILGSICNGYILGFVSNMSVGSQGFTSLLSLLPHGIFEFPAIFISLGVGLRLGVNALKGNKKNLYFKQEIINSLRIFLLIILPLLIIAAIIEAMFIIR